MSLAEKERPGEANMDPKNRWLLDDLQHGQEVRLKPIHKGDGALERPYIHGRITKTVAASSESFVAPVFYPAAAHNKPGVAPSLTIKGVLETVIIEITDVRHPHVVLADDQLDKGTYEVEARPPLATEDSEYFIQVISRSMAEAEAAKLNQQAADIGHTAITG